MSTKLKLVFETGYGQKTMSFNYIKPAASAAQIKNLMDTMIANGSVYQYPPLARVSATLETTSSTQVDVS